MGSQIVRQCRRGAGKEIVAPVEHQDTCSGQIRGLGVLQHLHGAQQNRTTHDTGMNVEDGSQKVRSVGVAEEGEPVRIETVARNRAVDEGCERVGFATDVRLIESRRVDPSEPAVDAFLGRPAAHPQERRMRRDAAGERHEVGLVSTGPVQQNQGRAVRMLRPVEAVNEGKVASGEPFFAGQGELRQHGPQIVGAVGIAWWQEQRLA